MDRDADLVTISDDKDKFFKTASHLILGDDQTVAAYIEESILRLNQMEAKVNILRRMTNLADGLLHRNPEWESAVEQAKQDWESV